MLDMIDCADWMISCDGADQGDYRTVPKLEPIKRGEPVWIHRWRQAPLTLCQSLAVLTLSGALAACDDNDVGEVCGGDLASVPPQPINSEDPVTEVIRLQRDRSCETLQCITHSGLTPYCTQSCELDPSTTTGDECSTDFDCDPLFGNANANPEDNIYCIDGQCIDDNCPTGFACREFQDVGVNSGDRFCVRQSGCSTNIDCGDVREAECRQVGCLDQCFLDEESLASDLLDAEEARCVDDAENSLTCEPFDTLDCRCPGGATRCEDSELECTPGDLQVPLPAGAVAQVGICFGLNQDQPEGN